MKPLTDVEVRAISHWKYDGEYSIYNENSYEDKIKTNDPLIDPKKRKHFTCVYLEKIFIGYIHLVENKDYIFFGIGLDPQCCGKGYGSIITKEAISLSQKKYPHKPIQLKVRSWNKRAIACYEKAGFRLIDEVDEITSLGKGHFYVMEVKTCKN